MSVAETYPVASPAYAPRRVSSADRGGAARISRLIQRIYAERGGVRVVDLGGSAEAWDLIDPEVLVACRVHVTLIGARAGEGDLSLFSSVAGGVEGSVAFEDNAFDLVCSDGAIERRGEWSLVERFAREIRRLAPRYHVRAPYQWAPVLPGRAPFSHWLPEGARARAAGGDLGSAMRRVQGVRPLDRAQMRWLFPDAELLTNRAFGLPVEIVAVRG